ncbi:DNA-binding protein [Bordetella sp. N]|nr:DNA-binding protein [Bordetella sp. N]
MALLTVSAKGRITLTRDLLQHLGIKPGEPVNLEKLSGGELRIRARHQPGNIGDFFHALDGRSIVRRPLTIEEMSTIAVAGWSRERGDKR